MGQRLSGRFVGEAKALMHKYCGQLGRIIEEKALEALAACVVTAEEVLDFCLAKKPRKHSWSITLKDLAVRQVK